MAKIKLSKLGLKKLNIAEEKVSFNEQEIIVKQYLPINDKLNMIADIINKSTDLNNFYNPGKIKVAFTIDAIKYYTNVDLGDKEDMELADTYDLITNSGFVDIVLAAIPNGELDFIKNTLDATVKAIYDYNNSVLGIIKAVSADYENLNLDAKNITENLSNKDNLALLKDVVSKLG
jgi:hypothetical protein